MATLENRDYIINKWKLYYKWQIFNVDELAQNRLLRAKQMFEFMNALEQTDDYETRLAELEQYIPDNQIPFLEDIINTKQIIWKSVNWPVRLSYDDVVNLLTISMLNQYYTYLTAAWLQAEYLPYIQPLNEDWTEAPLDPDEEKEDDDES